MTQKHSPNIRRIAAKMLSSIEAGKRLDEVMDRLNPLSQRDRNMTHAIVLMALRRRGEIMAMIKQYVSKPIPARPHLARALLQIGIAQLCYMDIKPYAALNETINAMHHKEKPYRGLLNAVLRQCARNLPKTVVSPRSNIPDWMFDIWISHYGEDTAYAIATQHIHIPPLDICFKNPETAKIWAKTHHHSTITPTHVRISTGGFTNLLPHFSTGEWWVQDVASGLPLLATAIINNPTVLDVCSAPGGKTLQLVAKGAKVTSLDISHSRLSRLRDNLERTHLNADIICADVFEWETEQKFDIVLLDTPCSATGIMRRHPDILIHRKPSDITKFTMLQDRLLDKVAPFVKHMGQLIYCNCSLDPLEGEERIIAFLKRNPDFTLSPFMTKDLPDNTMIQNHILRTTPNMLSDRGGMDGFFSALMTKNTNVSYTGLEPSHKSF